MTAINIDDARIHLDDDIIFMSVSLYKYFLKNNAFDALLLYNHLQFTARLQQTNSVRANDVYLKRGLGWGRDKLKSAKAFLHKSKIIEYKQERDENGKFKDKYIIVRTKRSITPVDVSTVPPADRTTGDSPQMLKLTSKCLNITSKDSAPKQVYIDLVQYLYNSLMDVAPVTKYQNNAPDLIKWCDPVRLLHERDGIPIETIRGMIEWIFYHDTWKWKTIIQSADSLRKHYNKIEQQMKQNAGKYSSDVVARFMVG